MNTTEILNAIKEAVATLEADHSKSSKGILRGLHYQLPPKAQGKLVRVIQGEVFDVVVDIRKSSPTFGQWVGEILSADNKNKSYSKRSVLHLYNYSSCINRDCLSIL